jgi:disulfide oxidoreductase YuzD
VYPDSNAVWLRIYIKQKMQDRFIQFWLSEIENSVKALNYRLFKRQLETENYFYSLDG